MQIQAAADTEYPSHAVVAVRLQHNSLFIIVRVARHSCQGRLARGHKVLEICWIGEMLTSQLLEQPRVVGWNAF